MPIVQCILCLMRNQTDDMNARDLDRTVVGPTHRGMKEEEENIVEIWKSSLLIRKIRFEL